MSRRLQHVVADALGAFSAPAGPGGTFSNYQPTPAPSVPWWQYQNSMTAHGQVTGTVKMDSTISTSRCLDKGGVVQPCHCGGGCMGKCVTQVNGPRGTYTVVEKLGPETTFRYNT